MISVTELRSGKRFLLENQPWEVVEYKHVKMGRGNATIKVKSRNLKTGAVLEKSFLNGAKVEEVDTQRKQLQFLYREKDEFFFADTNTYEQTSITKQVLGEKAKFLIEGEPVTIVYWDDQPLAIELPTTIIYTVSQTDPGVKGNSATNVFKPATMTNGLLVKVPLFINIGDKIRVDSRNGDYQERAK